MMDDYTTPNGHLVISGGVDRDWEVEINLHGEVTYIGKSEARKICDHLSKLYSLNTRADGWISVRDRLPLDEKRRSTFTVVIVARKDGRVTCAKYNPLTQRFLNDDFYQIHNVTHWQTTPAEPESK